MAWPTPVPKSKPSESHVVVNLESWCVVRSTVVKMEKVAGKILRASTAVLHPGCQMFSRVFSQSPECNLYSLLHLRPDAFAYLISCLMLFAASSNTRLVPLWLAYSWINLHLCSCARYLRRALCFAFWLVQSPFVRQETSDMCLCAHILVQLSTLFETAVS